MASSNIEEDLLPFLPKCEHHIHIEGALTPELLFTLAKKNNITLPTDDKAFTSPATLTERYRHFASLDDFLHYYYIGMSVLITAADFEALATSYFSRAARDTVRHADVFFDPQAHLSRGVDYPTLLAGLSAAQSHAKQTLNLTSELVCCFLRHLPAQASLATFHLPALQASFASGAVRAIGLDSSEAGFPPHLFADLYADARALGLNLTAHAGEEAPPEYIRSALDDLHVSRIDHGRRLPEDPELLARVAAQGTLLTLCPISNVFLRGVGSVSELPVREFLDAGVKFSINSDDPAYFGGNYIGENYAAVQRAFALSVGEWEGVCRAAIEGSWCGEGRKGEMRGELERVVGAWRAKYGDEA
ncbi:Adenine deaminase [Cladosporium halotolerans]|uniref:Adenine deaminase n=1 Tax=Cladosporium halotolerans TaxID=1052096 RepID=A0AB34KRJ1_9PEZI